jgi:hypothetical protein
MSWKKRLEKPHKSLIEATNSSIVCQKFAFAANLTSLRSEREFFANSDQRFRRDLPLQHDREQARAGALRSYQVSSKSDAPLSLS